MKRLNLYALSSVLLVMGVAGTASAQEGTPIGISLRAGLFFPTNSSTSSAVGSTWFGFGAQYKLMEFDNSSELHPHLALSLDYFARNSINETPILLNYVVRKDSFFGSIGAGITFNHTPGSSTTHFGYQLGVGYDIPSTPVFLEAKYWGNDDSNFNGVGVYGGIRF